MTTTPTSPDQDMQWQLQAAEAMIEELQESFADVQRALERDTAGWAMLGSLDENLVGFNDGFRRRAAARNVVAAAANPLVKRGVTLRTAYVWSGGVNIAVDDQPDQGQDVNQVVQAFLDDPDNQQTWSDLSAHVEHERRLCTIGEVWLCLPTDQVTGRVRVRELPASQITRIYTDPEDESSEWLYLREWTPAGASKVSRAWYPRLGYRPAARNRSFPIDPTSPDSTPVDVRWDQPVRPVRVNTINQRGLGDLFAAVPWAEAYKGYLEDWRRYMRALVQFAWRVRTRGDKVGQATADLTAQQQQGRAGAAYVADPNTQLEAISKTGATVDAESGRPLAAMVAAALDLPVTTLLGDPGVTGARATAETVSDDSEAVFTIRRDMWASVIREVCGWVIDAAVIAPAGPLRGTIVRDGDRQTAQLPDGDGRTVNVEWPDDDDTAKLDAVKAVQIVDNSELAPPLVVLRMYLNALGLPNVDEVLDLVTDDTGNYLPPTVTDATVRANQQNRGLVA